MLKIAIVFVLLIVLCLIYILYIRPMLEKLFPKLVKPLPTGIKTARGKVAAQVRNSLSMTVAWLFGILGTAMQVAVNLGGEVFSNQEVKDTIKGLFAPEYIPYYIIGVGVIMGLSRLRSIIWSPSQSN